MLPLQHMQFPFVRKDSKSISPAAPGPEGSKKRKVVVRKVLKRIKKKSESEQSTPTASTNDNSTTDNTDTVSVASSEATQSLWDAGGYSHWREEAWAEPQWEKWAWPPYPGWKPSYWQQAYWEPGNMYKTPEQPTKTRDQASTRSTLLTRGSTDDLGSIQDQLQRCNSGDQASFQYRLDEAALEQHVPKGNNTQKFQDCRF